MTLLNEKPYFYFVVCFLQETHSTANDESFWLAQWGDKALFSLILGELSFYSIIIVMVKFLSHTFC